MKIRIVYFLQIIMFASIVSAQTHEQLILLSAQGNKIAVVEDYINVNGVKLHYVSAGEGDPVLLIPGWFQTWYAWRFVIPQLVEQGFHVIAVDPKGMGHSDKPMNGYDTAQIAKELNQLMVQLGYKKYSVVGHDIGMWIGYALAADYGANIDKLAIVEAIIPGLLQNEPEVFMPQEQSTFFWQFMFNQQPDLPELLIQDKEDKFLSYLFSKWAFHPEKIALEHYIKIYSSPGSIRSQMAYYRAFPDTIAQNKIRASHKLAMPVLALGGDHGVGDFPREMMMPVTNKLTTAVLKSCGHFAPEECPEQILEKLLPFLKQYD